MNSGVVITGIGLISSVGSSLAVFTENIKSGVSGLVPIDDPAVSHFRAKYAGTIRSFDAASITTLFPDAEPLDRYAALALYAAREAVAGSGLAGKLIPARTGICCGTCSGPMLSIEAWYARRLKGAAPLSYADWFSRRYHSAARITAADLGITGPCITVGTACSASVNALSAAADFLRLGMCDVMLAGGSDAFSLTTLAGFDGIKATTPGCCAPFSLPPGINLGEGAGFFILETASHAAARNARVWAHVLGFGSSNDAFHPTSPDASGKGQARAMTMALAEAGITASSLMYINAHGTGTEANDKAETKAMVRALGDAVLQIPVSSTKGALGHCLGAAGALEISASLVALSDGIVPPTVNFTTPREGCTLDYVPDSGRKTGGFAPFMNNNFAFGGNNASVILSVRSNERPPSNRSVHEPLVITGLKSLVPGGQGTERIPVSEVEEKNIARPDCGRVQIKKIGKLDSRSIDRRIDLRGLDAAGRFATVCAWHTLEQSRFNERGSARDTLGVFLGCAHAPSWAEAAHITPLLRESFRLESLTAFPFVVPNSVGGSVCRTLSLTGPNCVYCMGQGASLFSMMLAANAVRSGHVESALCGSADELFEENISEQMIAAGAMGYSHLPLSEGAAMAVIETRSAAQKRGAPILASLHGYALAMEQGNPFAPVRSTERLVEVIHRALNDAGIAPEEIGKVVSPAGNGLVRQAVGQIHQQLIDLMEDVDSSSGFLEASGALARLMETVYSCIETGLRKKYILYPFQAPDGFCGATVFSIEPS